MINTPPNNNLMAYFPLQTLKQIVGEPIYDSLYQICMPMPQNSATIEIQLALPCTNCSGFVELPAVYLLDFGTPSFHHIYPEDQPMIPLGSNVVTCQNSTNNFTTNFQNWQTRQSIESL